MDDETHRDSWTSPLTRALENPDDPEREINLLLLELQDLVLPLRAWPSTAVDLHIDGGLGDSPCSPGGKRRLISWLEKPDFA